MAENPPKPQWDPESTITLLKAWQEGNEGARNRLLSRYLPILQKWAHGRLPRFARDMAETSDLVQVCLLRSLEHLQNFEPRWEGAFLVYLRQILLNALRDEIRKSGRKPDGDSLEEEELACLSPLGGKIGPETLIVYERGLKELPEQQRAAVILRLEFGFTYPEIAQALNKPTGNAARMMVARAMVQLAEVMG